MGWIFIKSNDNTNLLYLIQISHVNNAAKDSEMVAMKNSWIYEAIVHNRKGSLINSTSELDTYKREMDHYFLWVRNHFIS